MKLAQFEIYDFRCVRESGPIRVDDITCLLGKNEAGKTALLKGLYRLNPILAADTDYDVIDDYPRATVDEYEQAVSTGQREHAMVCRADYKLDHSEVEAITTEFGPGALNSAVLTLSKGYGNSRSFFLDVDSEAAYQYYIQNLELPTEINAGIGDCSTFGELARRLETNNRGDSGIADLAASARRIDEQGLDRYLYLNHLRPHLPQFVYFNDYYQLRGQENLEALRQRIESNELRTSDHAILGLLSLARLDVDQMLNPGRTQLLINKLEGASSQISDQVFQYWSQNPELQIKFDVRPSNPDDPNSDDGGVCMWTSVFDPRHAHSTLLTTRSRGFVWFFSFLAWYSELQKAGNPVILLLDEPGLHLHPSAQADLLRFFNEVLGPSNQLIYTTHSPFLVPSERRHVRYVEDTSSPGSNFSESESGGTKVTENHSEASTESVMPADIMLRSEHQAESVDMHKTLFVEDVSDLLYLRAMAGVLSDKEQENFESWTVLPVGGVENIPSVLAQMDQDDHCVTVLSAVRASDEEIHSAFRDKAMVPEENVKSLTEFSGTREAGIEDLFDILFYMNLVNAAYRGYLQQPIRVIDLSDESLRVRDRVSDYLATTPLQSSLIFNPRRPARLFADNVTKLEPEIGRTARDRFSRIFEWLNRISSGLS